jgi:hypothetical protein
MKNKSVHVLIVGILIWFYGPRLAYIFEWSFGSNLKLIGIMFIVVGGLNFIIKLSTKTATKN